jgi:WD40 repeat protein
MFTCALALILDLCYCLPLLQPGTDSRGDPLPAGALFRLGTTRFGHHDPITWIGFTNDKTVLTTSNRDNLRFWDVATGKESARYYSHSPRRYFALSADGKKLALHRDEVMSILDVVSRNEIRRLTFEELFGPEQERWPLYRFILSPNGRLLAIWDDHPPNFGVAEKARRRFSLDVWDLDAGRRIRTWKTGDLYEVEFTPDGKALVAQERGKQDGLHSWEIGSGKELRRVELPRPLYRFVFTADGKTIIGLSMARDSLHQFEARTGKELRAIADKGGPIVTFALSRDRRNLALVQGGRLIVQGLDSSKVVLDVPLPVDSASVFDRHSFDPIVELAAFSADGNTLAVANGRRVELWNLASGTRLNPDETIGVPIIAINAHGHHLLARDLDMNLSLWDLRTRKLQRRFFIEGSSQVRPFITDFLDWGCGFQAISPDGHKIAALWSNGLIHLFDLASGKQLHHFKGSDQATCLAFSPDGKLLAAPTTDGRICLWDVTTGAQTQHLTPLFQRDGKQRSPTFLALRFSPDCRTLAASAWESGLGHLLIWELAAGNLRFSRHTKTRQARFNYSFGDLSQVDVVENLTMSFLYTPDGKHVAAAGPRAIRLWEASTGKEVRRFGGHDIAGQSAAFSPDGKYLAAGLDNGGIRYWSATTGAVVRDAPAHSAKVTSVAFADEGRTMVSASLDGTAIVWNLDHLLKKPPLDHADLEPLWLTVGQTDAEKAAQAMQALTDRPKETIALCKERLRPVPVVDPKRLGQLIVDLQNDQYSVRQRATDELQQLGGQARSALEKVLDAQPPVEARRRVEALLKKLERPFTAPDLLRSIRAVEVLERIGSIEARLLLETLAGGGRGHRLTEDARDAVDRLSKRP